MSKTFTPPVASKFNPPILPESRGPALGLFRHYISRARGVNVFKLSDGTYVQDNDSDSPVSIKAGNVPYPWDPNNPSGDPATGQPYVMYTDETGAVQTINHPLPYIVHVYWAAHPEVVSDTEATALTNAGYGACLV